MIENIYRKTVVLVTGACSYLGAHCVQQLLRKGYNVRGTVRSLQQLAKLQPLYNLAAEYHKLQLIEADLTNPAHWDEAVAECRYVLHVESPCQTVSDDTIVQVAVEGMLNILRACARCATVRKVIVTSSCMAINEGHKDKNKIFTEEDWTDTASAHLLPYIKSKTEAEQAAWDFVKRLQEDDKLNHFKMTVLNPSFLVGPMLTHTEEASISLIRQLFKVPAVPPMQFGLIDIRDVATAHIYAMFNYEMDGHRILLTTKPSLWALDIADILRKAFRGYRVPYLQMPYPIAWLYSCINPEWRKLRTYFNRHVRFNIDKSDYCFALAFRDPKIALIEMVHSMIEHGILPRCKGYQKPHIKSNHFHP